MIDEASIDQIKHVLTEKGISEAVVADLRESWPDIHFTYCSDDDVCGPKAVRETEKFCIYLIDSRNHCLNFTSDPEIATGLVLAEIEEDF